MNCSIFFAYLRQLVVDQFYVSLHKVGGIAITSPVYDRILDNSLRYLNIQRNKTLARGIVVSSIITIPDKTFSETVNLPGNTVGHVRGVGGVWI